MKKYIIVAIVSFSIGAIIAIVFYPSKTIIKTVEVESIESKEIIADLTMKLRKKENIIIIEKPSGEKITKIIRITEKQEIDNTKTNKDSESRISEYNKTEINKKSFGIEIGINSDKSYYGHVTYDVFSSLFVGGHVSIGNTNNLGFGVGLRL